MKIIGIIPARMGSSRFPGKPLEELLGMPMIHHCYLRAKMVSNFDEIFIATCDEEIKDFCNACGLNVIMTSEKHERATDRTSEAIQIIENQYNINCEIVIMIQGDEPLVSPSSLSLIIDEFKDIEINVVNLISPFKSIKSFRDYNNVKVVFDNNCNALYFSREPIPSNWKNDRELPIYNQVGVIGFRKNTLKKFLKLNESTLEKIESVDMNRFLENGITIKLIKNSLPTLGVDNKLELKKAEKMLQKDFFTSRYLNLT